MGTQRSRFEACYRLPGAKHPEEEKAVLSAADAFDEAQASGLLTAENLAVLVGAIADPRFRVWTNCTSLMGLAVSRWPAAAEALRNLMTHAKAQIRFSVLCCLDTESPPPVAGEMMLAGLKDKSFRVRWEASEKVNALERRDLLPALDEALKIEKHLSTRGCLERDIGFLRDGYLLKSRPDGRVDISIRLGRGGTGTTVTVQELQEKGAAMIVEEYLKKHGDR
jgi:hypothetical protein